MSGPDGAWDGRGRPAATPLDDAPKGDGRTDRVAALLVFLSVVAYLLIQPHNLGTADESVFLLEALRVRNGELLYRDMFWYGMPLAHWTFAAIFAIAGASIEVARAASAILHAAVALLVYDTARRGGVSRALALVTPVAYIALCQAPWPYASPHWCSTAVMVALFAAVLAGASDPRPRCALLPGLLTGALAAMYQQKGAALAAGVVGFYAARHLTAYRFGAARPGRELGAVLLVYGLGCAAVVVPVLAFMLAVAGTSAVVEQIVVTPMRYVQNFPMPWGGVSPFNVAHARYTWPQLLAWSPLVVPLGLIRCGWRWAARRDRVGFDRLLAMSALGGAAALSIGYLPDFIHIAFIAPLFLVFWAETAEAALRWAAAVAPAARTVRPVLASSLLAALGWQLYRNTIRARADFPIAHQTAFGRVHFNTAAEVELVDRVRALLDRAPSRAFFAYPVYPLLYLTTGAENPMPFQWLYGGYHSERLVPEAARILAERRLPYVFACFVDLNHEDPVLRQVSEHYGRIDAAPSPCGLYQRSETD